MGEDPDVIRHEIEQTRERMGDTVDAIGYKADVPSRAKESISDKVHGMKSKISGAGSHVSDAASQVSGAAPGPDDVKQAGRRAAGLAQENPLGLAIGAAAIGFLSGLLVPSTKIEDERLGPISDQVKEQAKETGQEALEHGKQVAQETAEIVVEKVQDAIPEVKDAAQETAQQHADELKSSVQESAETVRQTAQR